MIDRYNLSPLKEIWSDEAKYKRWLDIEAAIIYARTQIENLSSNTYKKALNININAEEIQTREGITKHDVAAFVQIATERMQEDGIHFHKGLTSSDIVDTANAMAIKESLKHITIAAKNFRNELYKQAKEHKTTLTIGRTHGIHAEPTTFGLKLLSFVDEMDRNLSRLQETSQIANAGKISGAVGNYAHISPKIESIAIKQLGLKPARISSQIINRDIYAHLISTMALIGSCIERFATEIRHLQRTEIAEAQEGFSKAQIGSSAMPQKKNPISSEQMCGLARVLRGHIVVAMENTNLWHERDISHSSAERYILPESLCTIFYMLKKSLEILANLNIDKQRMAANINDDKIYAQRLLGKLLEKGYARNEAYSIIQECCFKAQSLKTRLQCVAQEEAAFKNLDISECFTNAPFLKHIDEIFERFKL
jgi:adenylosuccinate lyase